MAEREVGVEHDVPETILLQNFMLLITYAVKN